MKFFLTLFTFFNILFICGQEIGHMELPRQTYSDFGFNKKVIQEINNSFRMGENGEELIMTSERNFDEFGNVINYNHKIPGDYGSTSFEKYVYKNGLLDSIIHSVNYNSNLNIVHYEYADGVLQKAISTGKYSNYVENFSFKADGKISSIQRINEDSTTKTASFVYIGSLLDHVIEEEVSKYSVQRTYYLYAKGIVFATFKEDGKRINFRSFENREIRIKNITGDLFEIATKCKKDFLESPELLTKRNEELFKNSEIVYSYITEDNVNKDWIKKYQKGNPFYRKLKTYVFREIKYADGKVTGKTEFDRAFEKKVKDLF